jgi:hypothetical protein
MPLSYHEEILGTYAQRIRHNMDIIDGAVIWGRFMLVLQEVLPWEQHSAKRFRTAMAFENGRQLSHHVEPEDQVYLPFLTIIPPGRELVHLDQERKLRESSPITHQW